MVLTRDLLLPIPNGLAPELAALTEPMAVGLHAVGLGALSPHDVPLVIGCGPVGLAVIAALEAARGGADRRRRFLAGSPRVRGAHGCRRRRRSRRAVAVRELAQVAVARSAEQAAPPNFMLPSDQPLRPAVMFECVGIPGVVDAIVEGAPPGARIVVVGVCMERDAFRPLVALVKEISLRFAFYYSPEEYAETLAALGDGRIDVAPLVTGRVGLDGVAGAFRELATPARHAKILVKP